ncbi:MAG: hypothetical protein ACI3XD_03995 [Oscillospiraceae bacterium]
MNDMKEFMTAAFPWLLMGLALAVIAAAFAEAWKNENKKKFGQRLAAGAGLGVVAGAVLYACGFLESSAVCFAIGPLLGMAAETLFRNERGGSQS